MKKTQLIMVVVGIAIVIVVVFFLSKNKAQAPGTVENGPVQLTVNYNSADKNFTAQTTRIEQGKQVKLKVTSDIADELHLHGYDRSIDLESGKLGEIDFTADLTGRFEFELENHKTTLGVIEVYPK